MGRNQLAALGVVATLTLLGAACTSASPHAGAAKGHTATPAPGGTPGPAKTGSVLARAGLLVPATYQQACARQPSVCWKVPTGPIPAVLGRPLHFPVLRPGQRCPASHGSPVTTSDFDGIALGKGPVRPVIANAGDLRHGVADLLTRTSAPPWLALKTLWFSVPAYQGPFVIRAKRLGHPGPVALGAGPTEAPIVVPPGPALNNAPLSNGRPGYREAPGGLWVKSPGCYAWQVDGLKFSEIIVVHAVLG